MDSFLTYCQYQVMLNVATSKSAIGDFMFFLGIYTSIRQSFINLIEDVAKVQEGELVLRAYHIYLAAKPTVIDTETEILQDVKTVSFENVSFSYPLSDNKVFDNDCIESLWVFRKNLSNKNKIFYFKRQI